MLYTPKLRKTMNATSEKEKYFRCVREFLNRVNILDATDHIDDEIFMIEQVFPISNEQFKEEYWRYRNADHYLRNKEFYNNPENYETHPIY